MIVATIIFYSSKTWYPSITYLVYYFFVGIKPVILQEIIIAGFMGQPIIEQICHCMRLCNSIFPAQPIVIERISDRNNRISLQERFINDCKFFKDVTAGKADIRNARFAHQ